MWKRRLLAMRSERGNAMLTALIISIMIIMITGGALDLGLYYIKYHKAKSVADTSTDMVQKMQPVYMATDAALDSVLSDIRTYAIESGLESTALNIQLDKTVYGRSTNAVYFSWSFIYNDSYDCLFLSLLGINELPLKVRIIENFIVSGIKLWQPGDSYVDWDPYRYYPRET